MSANYTLSVDIGSNVSKFLGGMRQSIKGLLSLGKTARGVDLERDLKLEKTQNQISQLNRQMEMNALKMDQMRKKAADLRKVVNTPFTFGTDEQKKALIDIEKAMENTQNQIIRKQEEMRSITETGRRLSGKRVGARNTTSELDAAQSAVDRLIAKQDELAMSYANLEDKIAQTKVANPNIGKATADLAQVEQQMRMLQGNTDKSSTEVRRLEASLEQAGQSGSSGIGKVSASIRQIPRAIAPAKKALSSLFSAIGRAASAFNKKLSSAFNRSMQSFSSVGKKAISPINGIHKAISQATRRILLMGLAYKAVRAAASYLFDALKTNKQFAASLNAIKVNLFTAFQPIYEYVLPAINSLMAFLSRATGYIAAFTSALFGKTYAQSKKAAESTYAATKSMKDYGKAAKDTNEQINNATAGFDQFNDITANKADGSTPQIGSPDDKAPNFAAVNQADIANFESWWKTLADAINGGLDKIDWEGAQTKVSSAMKNIAESLNKFVSELDWKKIGNTLAQGLNTLLTGAYTFMTSFDWSNLGKSIVTGLNTAIQKTNWPLLGKTLASKWAALIDFLYEVVTGFDWSGFGQGLGKSINAWFAGIDWKKAGKTISDGLLGLLSSISSLLAEIDWQQVGQDIKDFLISIDWKQIVSDLAYVIGQALGGLGVLLASAIGDAVRGIGDYFNQHIEDAGGNVVLGLFNGILNALGNLGNWLYENLVKPFVDGFKSLFGIHSSSTVMEELGTYIIQGFFNGVASLVNAVVDLFKTLWENIKKVWSGTSKWFDDKVIKPIKKFFSDLWNSVTTWAKNTWSNIVKTFTSAGQWFQSSVISPITNFFKTLWNNISTWARNAWNGVVSAFQSAGSWFQSRVVQPVANFFKGLWDNLKSGAKQAWEWVSAPFKSAADWFNNTIVKPISNFFGGLWNGIKSGASTLADWIRRYCIDPIVNLFKGMYNSVVSIIEGVINAFIGIINGFIKGINWVINTINNIPGVNIRQLGTMRQVRVPRLAKGGLAYGEIAAIVGDNPNARQDPEVISPLSDLQQMITAAVLQRDMAGGGAGSIEIKMVTEDGTTLAHVLVDPMNKVAKNRGYAPVWKPVSVS